MLIGSSDQFETSLSPGECSQRLRQNLRSFSQASYAEPFRFGISKRGRTMIRMVGTLDKAGGGSTVRYRIEFNVRLCSPWRSRFWQPSQYLWLGHFSATQSSR